MEKVIKIDTQEEAQKLFGLLDDNRKAIEKEFKVKLTLRGEHLKVSGISSNINKAVNLIGYLLAGFRSGQDAVGREDLRCLLKGFKSDKNKSAVFENSKNNSLSFNAKQIGPRSDGQFEYSEAINTHDIVFGIGPAGTGKTYLAMACAVEALKKQQVRRIILTRPAIEAGESLGFLPGDMYEKISPYLRPLYDALYDMMEAEVIEKYLETGIIEVAPLAYMRGRTLNDAFTIMD